MTNEEKILDILAGMQSSMLTMSNDMKSVDNRMTKLEFQIETEIIPRLDSLAEGFAGIVETHVPRAEFDELAERVELLEMAQ